MYEASHRILVHVTLDTGRVQRDHSPHHVADFIIIIIIIIVIRIIIIINVHNDCCNGPILPRARERVSAV